MTQLIRRLRIPVVIMGVGAQSNLRYQTDRLGPVEGSVRAFVSAVLDRGPSIGVRGEFTHDYLRGLGFRDVEVIGCPSLFFDGDRLPIAKRPPAIARDGARLAINVSPYVAPHGPPSSVVTCARYPDLTYIPQDIDTLELLLWGEAVTEPRRQADPRPLHPGHPLFRDDKVRFFVDPAPWIELPARRATSRSGRASTAHRGADRRHAGRRARPRLADARAGPLLRDPAPAARATSDPATDRAADLYAEADFGPLVDGHAARYRDVRRVPGPSRARSRLPLPSAGPGLHGAGRRPRPGRRP